MLIFDSRTKSITSTNGGYLNEGLPIRDTFVKFSMGMGFQRGILYEPIVPCDKSQIGVVVIHSGSDYSTWDICGELAKRGYRVLGGQVHDSESSLDDKMLDIKRAVDFLYSYADINKVVLMGHSGGATLMSAYQNAAENGVKAFQGDNMLVKCTLKEELTPVDGVMLLDSNLGNGSMTLLSIDPAVIENGNGVKLDPELDYLSPANGFDPEGANYSEEFKAKYFKAQAERNNRIIEHALERLHAIENGKGLYNDDEPLVITGAAQFAPCNKLIPQDLHLLAHTKAAHELLHADGSITHEIVPSLRRANFKFNPTSTTGATVMTTVRRYLSEHAVLAASDYSINSDGVTGIEWNRCYDCTPANVTGIHVPLLCMGMTGGYEYIAAEAIYENCPSADKYIAFVEGATHNFTPAENCEKFPGQFGDTRKTLFDYVDKWLSADGRFIN